MNEHVKISIVVPVYNLQEELERCVTSIEAQSHENLEIILVDDGSTDNSWDVICILAEKDNRIIPIKKENGGVTSARLTGVEAATGEYIGFVDGDDEVEPDMYELLLNNAVKFQSDISHCGYQMVFPDGRVNFFHNTGLLAKQDKTTALRELLSGERVEPGLCNKLFHKNLLHSLLRDGMMDESIKINEDLLMNYYLFAAANKSVFEDVCKYHYLIRKSSASRQKLNKNKIYDPIHVKQIIFEHCPKEMKVDAEKALVNTSVYTFCSLVMDGRPLKKEKKDVQSVIKRHYHCVSLLPKRTRVLATFIAKMPACFALLYPVYSKWFQKKKYE